MALQQRKRRKCPRCGSSEVEEIIVNGEFTDEGLSDGLRKFDLYPIRPAESFACASCKHRWPNPFFEKYLLQRVVKEKRAQERTPI